MKSWKKIILPLAVIALGIIGFKTMISSRQIVEPKTPARVIPKAQVQSLIKTNHQIDITSQGNIQPKTNSILSSEVAGHIKDISPNFVNGGHFSSGDVLLQIDATNYYPALEQAKVDLARAKINLLKEDIEADIAQKEWTNNTDNTPSQLALHIPNLKKPKPRLMQPKPD